MSRLLEELVDPESAERLVAGELARALVTARTQDDLTDYLVLLTEIRADLLARFAAAGARRGGAASDPGVRYLLRLVASLAMIAAVLVRSAEKSGLVAEGGKPILADLFQRLVEQDLQL